MTTVTQALVAVSRQVDAIAKERTANAGGTYNYRGIEDVLAALHDPFIEHGILVVPQVTEGASVVHEIPRPPQRDGSPSAPRVEYEAQIRVNYRIYGPEGDYIDAAIFSTGVDSGDKSTGKAISYAYKQLMFQLLCIPTDAAEDNEASAPPAREPVPAQVKVVDEEWEALAIRLRALPDVQRSNVVKALQSRGLFTLDRLPAVNRFTTEQKATIRDLIERAEAPRDLEARDDHDNDAVVPRPEVTDTVGPLHPEHAVETVLLALGVEEVPEDLDPAFWYLAEFADADEIPWKDVAKALNVTQKSILDGAKLLVAQDPALGAAPDHINDINGRLAVETRLWLIKDSLGEPF